MYQVSIWAQIGSIIVFLLLFGSVASLVYFIVRGVWGIYRESKTANYYRRLSLRLAAYEKFDTEPEKTQLEKDLKEEIANLG